MPTKNQCPGCVGPGLHMDIVCPDVPSSQAQVREHLEAVGKDQQDTTGAKVPKESRRKGEVRHMKLYEALQIILDNPLEQAMMVRGITYWYDPVWDEIGLRYFIGGDPRGGTAGFWDALILRGRPDGRRCRSLRPTRRPPRNL